MSLVLRMVPNFGSYPDGRLRAGPFTVSGVGLLYRAMDKWGIRPGAPGTSGMVSEVPEGIFLSATGTGVFGYLLDQDALEASRTDLDAFLLDTTRPGQTWSITGHWCPDPDRMIRSEATAVHDGHDVRWFESRDIIHGDGTRQNIMRSRMEPLALLAHRVA